MNLDGNLLGLVRELGFVGRANAEREAVHGLGWSDLLRVGRHRRSRRRRHRPRFRDVDQAAGVLVLEHFESEALGVLEGLLIDAANLGFEAVVPLRTLVGNEASRHGRKGNAAALAHIKQTVQTEIAEHFHAPGLRLLGEFGFAGLADLQVVGGEPLAGFVAADGPDWEDAEVPGFADADGGFRGFVLEDLDADFHGLIPISLPAGTNFEIVPVEEFGGRALVRRLGLGRQVGGADREGEPGRDHETGGDPLPHENLESWCEPGGATAGSGWNATSCVNSDNSIVRNSRPSKAGPERTSDSCHG